MKVRAALVALLAVMLFGGVVARAQAGSACTGRALAVEDFRQADALARQVHATLERDAREAAILARAGADLSRHGLRFSHAALVLRESPGGHWRVVHLLNDCGRDTGALYREGLINFFLDDPFEYAALLLVPDPALQRRLREVAASKAVQSLFEPSYDMLAHPRSRAAQNSNQWLLELLAAAQAEPERIHERAAAQDWVYAHGFQPDVVRLSAAERLGARLFRANVRFDAQPPAARVAGRIEVVTVHALVRYLQASAPGLVERVLELPPSAAALGPATWIQSTAAGASR